MKNRYWNRNGARQRECDEMENDPAFEYSKTAEALFHRYYRYYNDGDLPGWARGRGDLTQHITLYPYRELNERGEEEFERRLSARIEIEYRRYKRMHNPA